MKLVETGHCSGARKCVSLAVACLQPEVEPENLLEVQSCVHKSWMPFLKHFPVALVLTERCLKLFD
jgi:hypothetical protein